MCMPVAWAGSLSAVSACSLCELIVFLSFTYQGCSYLFIISLSFIHIRPGKPNSQFIVTTFSVLHAGGRSLFRFHISYSVQYRNNKPQITGNRKPQIKGNH